MSKTKQPKILKYFSSIAAAALVALPMATFTTATPAAAWGNTFSSNQCASGWALARLSMKMDYKYWKYTRTDLRLVEISNPRLNYQRQGDADHTVGRQFCHANALLSDGKSRDLWYVLEKSFGFAGTPGTAGISFCIADLDRWHVYGRECSALRNYHGW